MYAFEFSEEATFGYIFNAAKCIFQALHELEYSGRLECYSAERFELGRIFMIGILLRPSNRQAKPSNEFWKRLGQIVKKYAERLSPVVTIEHLCCEFALKHAIEDSMLNCGIAEFSGGKVMQILGIDNENSINFIRDWLELSKKIIIDTSKNIL